MAPSRCAADLKEVQPLHHIADQVSGTPVSGKLSSLAEPT